eukprot:jgi/Tetstr1/431032/TSEL_020751.t1
MLKHQQKRVGGIIKHNTNVVKNMPATAQAFPGDNVDEGSSPEPPAKKAEPAAGVPAPGKGDAEARAGGGAFRSWAGRHAAVLHGIVGLVKQHQKAGAIIKHNTNVIKSMMAAT